MMYEMYWGLNLTLLSYKQHNSNNSVTVVLFRLELKFIGFPSFSFEIYTQYRFI